MKVQRKHQLPKTVFAPGDHGVVIRDRQDRSKAGSNPVVGVCGVVEGATVRVPTKLGTGIAEPSMSAAAGTCSIRVEVSAKARVSDAEVEADTEASMGLVEV